MDLKNLSEAELEIIVQVIQKDFELKAAEKARLRRHRRQLKDSDKRVTILSGSNFNENFCVICFQRFFIIFVPKRCCYSCRHHMCNRCSVYIPALKAFICFLCQKERNLKSMGCDWYYGLLKTRFQQDGSEIVAQSLYNCQGQYRFIHIFYRKICYNFKPEWLKYLRQFDTEDSIITPDLLKKVKGAQISRYRQKIQQKWEEMQERLSRLDQSNISKAKKDEAWHYMIEEYKSHFREILKEFSQFLYITLENYAVKIEDPNLNINEQVVTTVYDEVELLIGYRINYMPDEMGSILSDVESNASIFIGNQMEEKLAGALVNKIIQDHSLNELRSFDMKTIDNFPADDRSSTLSYVYHAKPYRNAIPNGTLSGRSSAIASTLLDADQSVEISKEYSIQYATPSITQQQSDSGSTMEEEDELSEIHLDQDEVRKILRYSKSDRNSSKHIIERSVIVPYGEPIKLQFHMSDEVNLEPVWTKTQKKRTILLKNSNNIEITETQNQDVITFCLRIWQSTDSDAGLYTVLMSCQPIVEFAVNIIENNTAFVKPTFRLKLMNCSYRTGQVAEFSVEALGYPEPRIMFYHNNQLIDFPSEKFRIDRKDNINRCTLKISNVSENDNGTYKCIATNLVGTCECSAQLQVTNVKFRFDKKLPRSNSSSNSSVEDDIFLFPPAKNAPKKEVPLLEFQRSVEPLNELVEIHEHLLYLESQLDWFEEQASLESMKSPGSFKSPDSTRSRNTFKPSDSIKSPESFRPPDSTKSPRSFKPPDSTKSPRSFQPSDPTKSPGSLKSGTPVKSSVAPTTVVGREIPDEFKIKEKLMPTRVPRPVHSYSTEHLDSIDASRSARMDSRHSLSNSSTNIARLRQLFEQQNSMIPQPSSITGRSSRPESRRTSSPFTREVRIPSLGS